MSNEVRSTHLQSYVTANITLSGFATCTSGFATCTNAATNNRTRPFNKRLWERHFLL